MQNKSWDILKKLESSIKEWDKASDKYLAELGPVSTHRIQATLIFYIEDIMIICVPNISSEFYDNKKI